MDPYLYPGTLVLNNRKGIRDSDFLTLVEADATSRRILNLEFKATPDVFYVSNFLEIHSYIFQDLYLWAGKLRTVEIARSGQMSFARVEHLESSLDHLFSALRQEHFLRNIAVEDFCKRAAYNLGELNAIHPFRDGNVRTLREFIRQLAKSNGYVLDWFRVSTSDMSAASIRSFQHGDATGLERLLLAAIQRSGV